MRMLKKYIKIVSLFLFFIGGIAVSCIAQDTSIRAKKDTLKQLTEVTVRGYLIAQPVLSVPASVGVLGSSQLNFQPENALVSALNTVTGVRMEERSPGSYRLSIRGSLLRSPFGVRDVKIYFDEIPLTDAGGNTYLNAIDVNSIKGIEILKGPDGSLFGANSGGVVLIHPVAGYNNNNTTSANVSTGSYGFFREGVDYQNILAKNQLNINQAFQTNGGYRQHSYMQRNYIQVIDKFAITQKDNLKVLGLYSALNYEAPGGLTLSQYQSNPQWARQSTKTLPSAIQQKSGIYQKVLWGGVVNELCVNDRVKNISALYGSYVDFSNPFITTYNQRYEGTYGFRTRFQVEGRRDTVYNWIANIGLEWQQTNSDINSYGNKAGVRDTAQTLDKINTNQHFIFAQYIANIHRKIHLETALSLNFYDYRFRNTYPNSETLYTNRGFTPQLMPRVALSYQFTNDFVWRGSVSRGYSTPTTGEIRPTDKIINTALQAENGWNYETGFRLRSANENMFVDASVFYFNLNKAIVQQQNSDGSQYYINAGGTKQIGFELYFMDWIIPRNNVNFVRGLQINESVTLNRFSFVNYHSGVANYSGNQLTGVPNQVLVTSVQFKLPSRWYIFITHNYTSKIPLNDANTTYAGHYNLVQAKMGWEKLIQSKTRLNIYAGIDNALNEKYSLGNDLNAVGGRYYNASAPRNYYIGLRITL